MNTLSKRLCSLLFAVCLIIGTMPLTVLADDNAWNPSENIYNIATLEDLFAFRDYLDNGNTMEGKTVCLLNDINENGNAVTFECYHNSDDSVTFKGTFEGNGFKICHLNLVSADSVTAGFFPVLLDATIKDLTLSDITLAEGFIDNGAFCSKASDNVIFSNCHLEGHSEINQQNNIATDNTFTGGFVPCCSSGNITFENCTVGKDVCIYGYGKNQMLFAGGFIGAAAYGNSGDVVFRNCKNEARVYSIGLAAGFISAIFTDGLNISFEDCINSGDIIAEETENSYVYIVSSGFTGYSTTAYIFVNRCANMGNITCITKDKPLVLSVGGLISESNNANIYNSYNTGNITVDAANSSMPAGGIAGHFRTNHTDIAPIAYNKIVNCYNVGNITQVHTDVYGADVGGIVGDVQEDETQSGNAIVENVYNFGNLIGKKVGSVCAESECKLNQVYGKQGEKIASRICNPDSEVPADFECNVGYYESADRGGKVITSTIVSGTETMSETPLPTDLKETLNQFVTEHPTVTRNSQTIELLRWTYSDGSDGLGIHPIFGDEERGEPENYVYLTTKDSVDINFEIDADYYTSDPNAYVELEYNHRNRDVYDVDRRVQRVNLKDVTDDDRIDGRYKFTIESAPAQLTEKINVTLKDSQGNELYKVEDYSMWKYCDEIIQNDISIHQTDAPQDVKDKMDAAAEVCKALTDYATIAQIYFNYNTSDMSSKSVADRQPTYYTENVTNEKTFHNINTVSENQMLGMPYGGAVASVEGELPFEIVETTLMSLANTEVRFYYDTDINPSDYELSLSVDDKWYGSARPSASFGTAASGNFIVVGGIESSNLDNTFNLTIRDKNTGKTATIHYSALAYCYTVLRDTKDNADPKVQQLRSLVKSVYLYNTYAQQYFVG
ncbi:MAG: hypothetical protein E7520_02550 [Ruminococcaceae bacterium]|nr:hypothetical protein [Oscillospiraceae bacterium]